MEHAGFDGGQGGRSAVTGGRGQGREQGERGGGPGERRGGDWRGASGGGEQWNAGACTRTGDDGAFCRRFEGAPDRGEGRETGTVVGYGGGAREHDAASGDGQGNRSDYIGRDAGCEVSWGRFGARWLGERESEAERRRGRRAERRAVGACDDDAARSGEEQGESGRCDGRVGTGAAGGGAGDGAESCIRRRSGQCDALGRGTGERPDERVVGRSGGDVSHERGRTRERLSEGELSGAGGRESAQRVARDCSRSYGPGEHSTVCNIG